jgi:hypothetical protein
MVPKVSGCLGNGIDLLVNDRELSDARIAMDGYGKINYVQKTMVGSFVVCI